MSSLRFLSCLIRLALINVQQETVMVYKSIKFESYPLYRLKVDLQVQLKFNLPKCLHWNWSKFITNSVSKIVFVEFQNKFVLEMFVQHNSSTWGKPWYKMLKQCKSRQIARSINLKKFTCHVQGSLDTVHRCGIFITKDCDILWK